MVDFILFPDREHLHSTYHLHDVDHAHSFSDILEMHYIEIVRFRKYKPRDLRTPFEKWVHLLKFADLHEKGLEPLPEVLEKEEGIALALEAMRRAWATDEIRGKIEIRERILHDRATRMEWSSRDGGARAWVQQEDTNRWAIDEVREMVKARERASMTRPPARNGPRGTERPEEGPSGRPETGGPPTDSTKGSNCARRHSTTRPPTCRER